MRKKIDSPSPRPRRLLLCLDGVPFEIIERARARGLFAEFNAPTKLLSPFPTMTNIALSTMLRASAPPGYESLYFDRATKSLQGGIGKYLGWRTPDKIPSSYMRELDYQEPLACEFLIYVAPERVWRADFRRFHERFQSAPRDRDFFAFIKATDGLLHLGGAEQLLDALQSLDKILRAIKKQHGAETEMVLFSDHGMNLVESKRVYLKSHLRRFGYTAAARLHEDNPCVVSIPAFGLCSYAAIYCADEEAANVAGCLATLEGVDFSLYREGDAAVIKGARGAARIHARACACGKSSYRYQKIEGDPLELARVLRNLKGDGEIDADGYATDAAWSARTLDHIYPNALSNLYGAICHARVGNTANVLVSLRDGYFYGARVFARMVRHLHATHGNARRESSTAFLMSTHQSFSPIVRAEDVYEILRDEKLNAQDDAANIEHHKARTRSVSRSKI